MVRVEPKDVPAFVRSDGHMSVKLVQIVLQHIYALIQIIEVTATRDHCQRN